MPEKRSLLSVNEHFEGERNDKIHFLFSLLCCDTRVIPPAYYPATIVNALFFPIITTLCHILLLPFIPKFYPFIP